MDRELVQPPPAALKPRLPLTPGVREPTQRRTHDHQPLTCQPKRGNLTSRGRGSVERLTADLSDARHQRGRVSLGDEVTRAGDALSHSHSLFDQLGAVKGYDYIDDSSPLLLVTGEGRSILFRRSLAQDVRSELSRLLNSQVGRQAARGWLELAGTIGAATDAAGLKGSWRASTCQLAIRILRATAALAALPCPCRRRTST